jgi:hypothetical protein
MLGVPASPNEFCFINDKHYSLRQREQFFLCMSQDVGIFIFIFIFIIIFIFIFYFYFFILNKNCFH